MRRDFGASRNATCDTHRSARVDRARDESSCEMQPICRQRRASTAGGCERLQHSPKGGSELVRCPGAWQFGSGGCRSIAHGKRSRLQPARALRRTIVVANDTTAPAVGAREAVRCCATQTHHSGDIDRSRPRCAAKAPPGMWQNAEVGTRGSDATSRGPRARVRCRSRSSAASSTSHPVRRSTKMAHPQAASTRAETLL